MNDKMWKQSKSMNDKVKWFNDNCDQDRSLSSMKSERHNYVEYL